jgi:hypothetical protein
VTISPWISLSLRENATASSASALAAAAARLGDGSLAVIVRFPVSWVEVAAIAPSSTSGDSRSSAATSPTVDGAVT